MRTAKKYISHHNPTSTNTQTGKNTQETLLSHAALDTAMLPLFDLRKENTGPNLAVSQPRV